MRSVIRAFCDDATFIIPDYSGDNRFCKVDRNGKLQHHGEPEFKISQGYGIPTGIMGFSDVQVTDKAIYTVFQGQSFKDIARSVQKGEKPEDGGRYIYVFSLTGEPLREYVLDHYIYGISVDEKRGVIYATDVNKDEPIVEYSLNGI